MTLSALGHKVFEMLMPINSKVQFDSDQGNEQIEYLYIKNKNGVSAKGFQSSEGFVVCKGSVIKEQLSANSINKNIIKLRIYPNGMVGAYVNGVLQKNDMAAIRLSNVFLNVDQLKYENWFAGYREMFIETDEEYLYFYE